MRVVQNKQMTLGEVDLSHIKFDLQSRDDIPVLLRGLQAIYVNRLLREQVFLLLEQKLLSPKVDKSNGRPGMPLWNILVCGLVRLSLNIDYDRLHNLVNEHKTLRQVLGHGDYNEAQYGHQTVLDNVSLFTQELLDKINTLVVAEGHALLKKDGNTLLAGRCDSFVVETEVHFPTDISLLLDAIRKILTLSGQWCEAAKLTDCRQYRHNTNVFKRLVRTAQNKKRSRAKAEDKQAQNKEAVKQAHQALLDVGAQHVANTQAILLKLASTQPNEARKLEIEGYIKHAERQMDQIQRRVIEEKVIPHEEKVMSIFETHTEWIAKGKAGVPQELGLRVCVLEDQYKFILHHRVMVKETDDAVPVIMVKDTQKKFPQLKICSFDKGFHSPSNQIELKQYLDMTVMPKKGKLSEKAKAAEREANFVRYRHTHSAVESAINALEVHGLDRCPDQGLHGFKRYVALAVLARNVLRLGAVMWQRDIKEAQRREKTEQRLLEKLAA